jgi:autotransporter-associated beta strand protein
VVVSATGGNYAFVSTTGNEITGAATLSKSGAGTLLLYGPNSYSGGTTLNGGTLALGHADAIGASGTISFGGGTLQSSEMNTADYSARFSNAASQQYKIDSNGQSVTLASNLTSSGGSFTKLGNGTVTLTGANTYSGATLVSAGKLLVNGSLANSAVTVGSGGTLGGGGSLGSTVTVQSGGVLSPGNSPGALAAAALDLEAGSTTFMQVIGSGSAAGTAGTNYDQIQIATSGGLTYGGTLNLEFGNGSSFANGTSFDLFAFSGSPVGHFSSVVSTGTGAYGGLTFSGVGGIWTSTISSQRLTFSELTGRLTVALAAVPEIDPATGSSALSLVAGMLAILDQRREQRRRRSKAVA